MKKIILCLALISVCTQISAQRKTEIVEPVKQNLGSVRKASCIHAHSFISLKRKKGISETPLN